MRHQGRWQPPASILDALGESTEPLFRSDRPPIRGRKPNLLPIQSNPTQRLSPIEMMLIFVVSTNLTIYCFSMFSERIDNRIKRTLNKSCQCNRPSVWRHVNRRRIDNSKNNVHKKQKIRHLRCTFEQSLTSFSFKTCLLFFLLSLRNHLTHDKVTGSW